MSSGFSKKELEALWPGGPAWKVAANQGLDKLLDGIGDVADKDANFSSTLPNVRNPRTTNELADLEKENGVITDLSLSEEIRRNRLASDIFNTESTGGPTDLQTILDDSGFNLFVYQNDPAVDPNLFLTQSFNMVLGGGNAFLGRADAFLGISGGELIVNGDIFSQTPAYIMQAGGPNSFLGNSLSQLGYFQSFDIKKYEYEIPTDPDYWPLIFFVGGVATRDPITNALTAIEAGEVEAGRYKELKTTILKYKPQHSWCGLIVNKT